MSAAIELARDNEFNTGNNTNASRLFYNEGTTSGLPAIGEAHPENATIFADSISRSPFGGHHDKHLFVVSYAPITTSTIDENTSSTDLPRRFEFGGELLRVPPDNLSENVPNWSWLGSGQPVPDDVDMIKIIPTGSLIITTVTNNVDALKAKIIARVGKINDAVFEGFAAGTLLYMGASAEEYHNSTGGKRWRSDHTFQFRLPTNTAGADADGWNYVYRANNQGNNGWDKPKDAGGKFLYVSAEFDTILTI